MNILRLITGSGNRSRRQSHRPRSVDKHSSLARSCARRWWTRARHGALFFGGGERGETRQVPASAAISLQVDGTILLISMTINGAIWFSALVYAEVPVWAAILVGLLAATLIGLLDRQILSALLSIDGEDLLKRQRQPGFYPIDKRRRWVLMTGRIVLSIASMFAASMLVRVAIFAPDIEQHLARQNREQNQSVRQVAERTLAGQIADARAVYAQAVRERDEIRATVGRTDLPPDTQAIDSEIETLRTGMINTIADYRRAYSQYLEYRRAAAAEQEGVRDRDSDTGRRGEGSHYSYAVEMTRQSAAQMDAARQSYANAARRIQQLQLARQQSTQYQGQQASAARNALNPRLAAADARVRMVGARREQLEANRPTTVRQLMENDPAYAEPRTGLIARVNALNEIQHGSSMAWWFSIAITAAFSILEMAVIWLNVVLGVPNALGPVRVLANQEALERALAKRRTSKAAGRKRSGQAPTPSNDVDEVGGSDNRTVG